MGRIKEHSPKRWLVSIVRSRALQATAAVLVLSLVMPLSPARAQAPSPSASAASVVVPLPIPDDGTLAAAARTVLDERPPLPEELPTFEAVRDEAHSIMESMAEQDWSIAALARQLEYDPERAFAFVRDSIGVDPYPGVLRGAEGTLSARAGSPADRALLLAALLDEMAVPVRFARGTLDQSEAEVVLDRASEAPTAPLPRPGLEATPVFPVEAIMARAARDYAQLRLGLGSLVPPGHGAAGSDALAAVRDHLWVQRRLGSEWQDLDPTMPTAAPGDVLVPATATVDALPDELVHQVRIRLEEERLAGDVLTTTPLVEYAGPAWDAADSELFLLFAPLTDRLGGSIREVLTGDIEWYPMLMIDGVAQRGQPFRVGSSGTDVFGDPGDASQLTAVRLMVDTISPGGADRHVERMLLDRVPSDVRAGGQVSQDALDPMPEDEGLPRFLLNVRHLMVSTGGADVRDYALQRYLAADYAGSTLLGATLADPPSAYDAVWPLAATDQALVVASETSVVASLVDGSGARAFVSGPRLFLTTAGRDPARPGTLAFVTDLAIDGVSVLSGLDETSEARLQLWYGALQTALESQLAVQRAALIEPESRTLIGASLGGSGDLRMVERAVPPPDASSALLADLASGSIVLRWTGDHATRAWWVVDPQDWATRSVVDPGLGGALPAGVPVAGLRTNDSSYSHGKGPRLPPRPPAQPQAPGGPRGGCTGGSEDTAIMCNVSLPGGIALSFNLVPVIVLTAEAAAFALLAWRVATG